MEITQTSTNVNNYVEFDIQSKVPGFKTKLVCGVLPKVSTTIPNIRLSVTNMQVPHNVKLADPTFNIPGEIDLLIGGSNYWDLLCLGKIRLANDLTLYNTHLGWIVTGEMQVQTTLSKVSFLSLTTLNSKLEEFWKVDDYCPKTNIHTPEEKYCESFFDETTMKASDGKFVVRYPFKPNLHELGDSYEVALSRFLNLERRFKSDESFKEQYVSCVQEYLDLGHAELSDFYQQKFYLPHHAVIKSSSSTTKCRVVFDGSCKLHTGLSVNQLQCVGPVVQSDLFSILLRFRTYPYVFTADIAKMYCQIWIHSDDRKFQNILWRNDPKMPLQCLQLKTVTFGMTSAPYLATRCLVEVARQNERSYPTEAEIIRRDFYVDDCLTGAQTVESLNEIKSNITYILSKVGFSLRKFRSNILNHAKVNSILNVKSQSQYFWSASKIVLSWLKCHPSKWATFVANRISRIQELTNVSNWNHISSSNNPADLISRGILSSKLILNELWWHGPKSLTQNEVDTSFIDYPIDELPERKGSPSKALLIVNDNFLSIIKNHSSINKVNRVMAWCLRFVNNCRRIEVSKKLFLSAKELNSALLILIKLVQMQSFPIEYKAMLNRAELHPKSSLLSLKPFLDECQLIRVGGRLGNADFPFDKRHPILLPKDDRLIKLIIVQEHINLLHAGPTLLLSGVRERFWPINGLNTAQRVVRECVTCFRYQPVHINPVMGDLPKVRVSPTPPFHTCGVDFAGPINIKDKAGRGGKLTKCYISLFICFSTKAIHLEPVSSLSSNAFLTALRRFVSRRGKPSSIYSDNATNFQGANNELIDLLACLETNKKFIAEDLASQGISWHFIPPRAPHFGGLWEAGVKNTKFNLKWVLKDSALMFEELSTVLCQIEASLNSRPLYPMSSNPNDLQTITPAHFLIGRPYTAIADPNVQPLKINTLNRYQYMQRLNQEFWKKWNLEYISQLQKRLKWSRPNPNVKVGDMVLIKEEGTPPSNWLLSRIAHVHPGKDDKIRVASVNCACGLVRRPVVKLCLLPLPKDDE